MRGSGRLVPILILAVLAGFVVVSRWQHGPPTVERPVQPGPVTSAAEPRLSPASPAGTLAAPAPSPRVRIREISSGHYEVTGATVRAVLDNAGAGLSDLALTATALPSFEAGMRFQVSSVMGDGVLTDRGFTVTDPKLAGAAGIQAGDTILTINGAPVGGFLADLLTMRRDPDRRTIEVELDRQGRKLIQTYRIR